MQERKKKPRKRKNSAAVHAMVRPLSSRRARLPQARHKDHRDRRAAHHCTKWRAMSARPSLGKRQSGRKRGHFFHDAGPFLSVGGIGLTFGPGIGPDCVVTAESASHSAPHSCPNGHKSSDIHGNRPRLWASWCMRNRGQRGAGRWRGTREMRKNPDLSSGWRTNRDTARRTLSTVVSRCCAWSVPHPCPTMLAGVREKFRTIQ